MPVKPALIFSTDDKTMWKFEGAFRNKSNKFVLVPSSFKKDNGTRSDYTVEEMNDIQGLRIKETFTFNAAGVSAPLFFSVYLDSTEMPADGCKDGFLLLKIPGLCIGGTGVTTGLQKPGFMFLICKDKSKSEESIDKVRYRIYMNNIFLPFCE